MQEQGGQVRASPTLEATSAAGGGIEVKADLTFFAGWADGDDAYPIAAQTWILAYTKQTDKAKGAGDQGFVNYVLTEGQTLAPTSTTPRCPPSLRQGHRAARHSWSSRPERPLRRAVRAPAAPRRRVSATDSADGCRDRWPHAEISLESTTAGGPTASSVGSPLAAAASCWWSSASSPSP